MNKKPLDQHIKDCYQYKFLSTNKVASMIEQHNLVDNKSRMARRFRWTIAATFILSFITASLTMFIQQYADYEKRVAEEIALNHNKQLSPEFVVSDIAKLAFQMNKLNFTLRNSKKIKKLGLTPIGARYCSIQGNIAAQIKLRDKKGEIYTLYQTANNNNLKSLHHSEYSVKGIKIKYWQESGIFFSLASGVEK